MRIGGTIEVGLNQPLNLGTNVNRATAAMMLRFVAGRMVFPNIVASIYVHRAKLADLARAASCEALESHHIGNDRRQERQRGINHGVVNGQNGGRLTGGCSTLAQSVDGCKSVVNGTGNQFAAHAPLEATSDFVANVV